MEGKPHLIDGERAEQTATAIASGETLPGPKVVVCPKSVQQQWADELMLLTGKVANVVRGTKAQRLAAFLAAVDYDWTIITYEQARELKLILPTIPFAMLVADEAQYLKNPLAQRTVAVLGSRHRFTADELRERRAAGDKRQSAWVGGVQAPKHLLLSGTPMLSRPVELWPLLRSVGPDEWHDPWKFKDDYCGKQDISVPDARYHYGGAHDGFRLAPGQQAPRRAVTTYNGASNVEELHRRLRGYYHRIALRDALPNLPELTKVDTKVTLNDKARRDYDRILNDFAGWLKSTGKSDEQIARTMQAAALAKIGHLRQCSITDKLEHISEMLDTLLEGWGIDTPNGKRIVPKAVPPARDATDADERASALVFCTYREPLLELKRRYGPLCGMITGAESSQAREEAKRAFQAGELPILLITIDAGGVGLNLQRARIVFLLNEQWTPSANEQAIGRAHRNGQKNGVTAYTLLATDSVDEAIHEALSLKAEVIAQVLDGQSAEDVRVTTVLAHVLRTLGTDARKRPGNEGRANIATNPRFRARCDERESDEEGADILGATLTDVILCRGTDGQRATERSSPMLGERRGHDARFRALYDEGRHDAEIARRMGVSRTAVGLWRTRQHPPLKPNRPFPSTKQCWKYYVRGMTDAAIAAATGLEINAIRHWRYRWVLPAVTKSYREEDEQGNVMVKSGVPDYLRYYTLGWNDAEIASAVNRTQSAVYSWRRDRGLPRNVRGRPKQGTNAVHVPKASRTPRGIIPPIDALRGPQV